MNECAGVLLVEDDDIDVEVITRLFKKHDIKTPLLRAANGQEALDIIRGEQGIDKLVRPYIILLDINMPLMNGIELLKILRSDEMLHESIVFVLTTSAREEDKQAASQHNVAGYFLKNNTADLPAFINTYCQYNNFPLH